MSNTNDAALKSYVDRMVAIEVRFQEAKADRNEEIKDLKAEIKSRYDETGVDPKEVVRFAKIRINEQESRETAAQLDADLAKYDLLYHHGKTPKLTEDDPLA